MGNKHLKFALFGFMQVAFLILALNSVNAEILINEFLPNSVNTDYEWIELYNNKTSPVNLLNFNISEEFASKNFTIGDITIGSKGFVVLARNSAVFNQAYNPSGVAVIEYGNVVPSLNLNDGGDSIFLYDSSGNLMDSILKYANPGENKSIGRNPDGSSKIINLSAITPGAKNNNQSVSTPSAINLKAEGMTSPSRGNTTFPEFSWEFSGPPGSTQQGWEIQTNLQNPLETSEPSENGTFANSGRVIYNDSYYNLTKVKLNSWGTRNGSSASVLLDYGQMIKWRIRTYDGNEWGNFSQWQSYLPNQFPNPPQNIVVDESAGDLTVDFLPVNKTPGITYYVKTDGGDSNSGLSPGSAFATINRSLNVANSGDMIVVYPGTYNELIVIINQNAANDIYLKSSFRTVTKKLENITIKAAVAGEDSVIIDGSGLTGPYSYTLTSPVIYINSKNIVLDGITVKNLPVAINYHIIVKGKNNIVQNNFIRPVDGGGIYAGGSDITIKNNSINAPNFDLLTREAIFVSGYGIDIIGNNIRNSSGIQIERGSVGIQIMNNVFIDSGRFGIFTHVGGQNIMIAYNLIHKAQKGIDIFKATHTYIFGNSIVKTGMGMFGNGRAISFDGTWDDYVYNNIITDATKHGMALGYSSRPYDLFYDYNLLYGNAIDYDFYDISNMTGTIDGGHNILDKNPLFTDSANDDYMLQPESPAVNTGKPNYPSPSGGIADIGRYEYGVSSTYEFQPLFTVFTSRPVIKWNFFDTDNDQQNSFQIEIDKANTFDSPDLLRSGTITSGVKSIKINKDLTPGVYYLRIRTADNFNKDIFGTWSNPYIAFEVKNPSSAIYSLSVSKAGESNGTVFSTPSGINCGSDCTENYDFNTVVTLTVLPGTSDTKFTGWSGACSGNSTCTITMSESKSVIAQFDYIPSVCGNEIIERGEVCDWLNTGSENCQTKGYAGGMLACSANCLSYVTTPCTLTVKELPKLFAVIYGRQTALQLSEMAEKFDLIDLDSYWYAAPPAIYKTKNPDIVVLGYLSAFDKQNMTEFDCPGATPGGKTDKMCKEWEEVNQHEDWFLHDENGKRIRVYLPQKRYGMDLSNVEYQNFFNNLAKNLVDNGYDGIFLDNTFVNFPYLNDNFAIAIPAGMDEAKWQSDSIGFLTALKSAIGGKKLVFNQVNSQYYNKSLEYLDAADGAMDENFASNGYWEKVSPSDYSGIIELLNTSNKRNKTTIPVGMGENAPRAFNDFCTYMLSKDGPNAYFSYMKGYSYKDWIDYPFFKIDLGSAKEDYYRKESMFFRKFDYGTVISNLDTIPQSVMLDREYRTADGRRITKLDINPKSCEIIYTGCQASDDNCAPCSDSDNDGYYFARCGGSDCDDSNSGINDYAEEICNGIDDNCNGEIDENSACSSIVLQHKFDSCNGTNSIDSSSYGNDGTINGASWADGYSNQGMNFDGASYIEVPFSNSLNLTSMTIEAWIYPKYINPTGFHTIIARGRVSSTSNYLMDIYYGTFNFQFSGCPARSPDVVLPNKWYHVAGTWDGENMKLYVNGILKKSVNSSTVAGCTAPPSISSALHIGDDSSNSYKFNGTVDEIKIYNRAKSAYEISADSDKFFTPGSCSTAPVCDNGVIDPSEVCDSTNLGGAACASVLGSKYTGVLGCASDCLSYDTTKCISISSVDNDNDGYNNLTDCNDNNPSINPGAIEICGNEIDENCDGVDLACVNDTSPIAVVTANPTLGIEPLTVSFTCSSPSGNLPLSYSWVFTNGQTSNLQNPNIIFNAGSHSGTCTVTDSDGDINSAAASTITVQPSTTLSATASANPTFGVVPLTVNFNCLATGGTQPYDYFWDFNDSSSSSQQNPTHTYNSAGLFNSTCWVADADDEEVFASLMINISEFINTTTNTTQNVTTNVTQNVTTNVTPPINVSANISEIGFMSISDVDAKVDDKSSNNVENNERISKEAEPGSSVEFKVKIKNNFESLKLENVKVKALIEGIDDGNDLEEESNAFDLSAGNDKTTTLKFKVPLNADKDTFSVDITAEGEDENGTLYEQSFNTELDVDKKKHDLRFSSIQLSPSTVSCNRVVNLNYKIINIGEDDEENAVFEAKNNDLGLSHAEKDLAINSDSLLSKSIKLKVSDEVESGGYPLSVNIYSSDGKLQDTKTAELKVADCIKFSEAKEEEAVLAMGSANLIDGIPKTQYIRKPVAANEKTAKTAVKDASSKTAERNMQILLVSTTIFTGFFVFMVVALLFMI